MGPSWKQADVRSQNDHAVGLIVISLYTSWSHHILRTSVNSKLASPFYASVTRTSTQIRDKHACACFACLLEVVMLIFNWKRLQFNLAIFYSILKQWCEYYSYVFTSAAINCSVSIAGKCRTYFYYFCQRPSFAWFPEWQNADHTAEIPFLIDSSKLGLKLSPNDEKMSHLMLSYWSNFARIG